MFTKFTKKFGFTIGCIFAVLIFLAVAAVSWIATCGIIYLITLCFGWTFNWLVATGIWLLMFLLRSIFSNTTTIKK